MKPHRGTTILVLGILSIVCCQILGPFAWWMGQSDMSDIEAGQMDPEGKSLTQVGMILGIIGTVLLVLNIVGMVIFTVLGGTMAAVNPG
ncbi:DUF4190 domain-containing protein [bacterium]|nr:DUF4190 domain-containing protein [bacterium]